MNILGHIIISIFLISCASNSSQRGDFDYSNIENKDFKSKKEVSYNINDDFYNQNFSNNDSLGKETIAKFPINMIEDEDDRDDPLLKSITLCYRKKISQGLEKLKEVYSFYKKNPSYWNIIGTCFLLKDNKKMALLYYNKARGLSKNFSPPYNNLGVIYQKDNLDQKALVSYKKSAMINRFAKTPKYNRGQLLLKYGFIDKSINIFNSLYRITPTDIDILNGLAFIQISLGALKNALNIFKKIPSKNFEKAQFGINYAILLKYLKYSHKAKEIINDIDTNSLGDYQDYYTKAKKYIGG